MHVCAPISGPAGRPGQQGQDAHSATARPLLRIRHDVVAGSDARAVRPQEVRGVFV